MEFPLVKKCHVSEIMIRDREKEKVHFPDKPVFGDTERVGEFSAEDVT